VSYLDPSTQDAMRAAQDATDPLDRLASIRNLIAALETDAASLAAVREALDAGAGWDEIAARADLSPAAAKWRWQGSDAEIASRHEAGRKRAARPSSKPRDLPGMSVAEAAKHLGISVQGVYQRITREQLRAETVTLDDGRTYKRVFPD
jgi:DNA invertase Pin-like site-specific DNA recombinase